MSINSQKCVIVKIGGSILTKSDGSVDRSVLEVIGRELAMYAGPAIVIHGTGRIGRAVLERHLVKSDRVPDSHRDVVLEFRRAVRDLNTAVVRTLECVGLSCNYKVPHKYFRAYSGQLLEGGQSGESLQFLNSNSVTILHGDAVKDMDYGYYFCSGDEIVSIIAARVQPECIVFLTNVDGVYNPFPPSEGDLPLLEIDRFFIEYMSDDYIVGKPDMVGKVRQAILAAEHAEYCYIANGTRNGLLARLLSGLVVDEDRFTRITNSNLHNGIIT